MTGNRGGKLAWLPKVGSNDKFNYFLTGSVNFSGLTKHKLLIKPHHVTFIFCFLQELNE